MGVERLVRSSSIDGWQYSFIKNRVDDTTEGLAWLSKMTGRPIESVSYLSFAEAQAIIKTLKSQ